MIKEIPINERPRERFMKFPIESISNVELIAILLKTGSKEESVIELSKKILYRFRDLKNLSKASISELKEIKGIGEVKAIELLSAMELGKRIQEEPYKELKALTSPNEIYHFMKGELENKDQEEFVVLYLNTKGKLIFKKTMFIGSLNSSLIHPREIYKYGVKESAASIIICHNHPSGNPNPSFNDIDITKRIVEAGMIMDIEVIDHVIIGKNRHFSFKENGLID